MTLKCLKPNIQKLSIKNVKINLIKLNKQKKTVDREKLYYRTNEHEYNFPNFRTISTFGRDIYNGTFAKRSW